MTPSPQHGTPAGDASIAIRRLARQAGGDVQELMTLYALEGLLARISLSEHRDDFVLKGGVLLAAFAARRPTKDIDLQATEYCAVWVTSPVRRMRPSNTAPSRSIARCDGWLNQVARKHTRWQPHCSNAWVSISSFASVLIPPSAF